ncbi:Transient receptor potential cation channel trpm [Orchesella cincta]|uniref:Transient receptor potential cation channel trpm n=1 Tax=Orchesella cincta TaxID=48709 RepID=A0A1D2MX63_ORCCI|nr:Transient receptor potential cation channel trpm [Orchesella cincta]
MADSNMHNSIRIPPKWIELNVTKRECCMFIAEPDDDTETMCQCGRRKIDHGEFVKYQHRSAQWIPSLHTRVFSTDAYGTILFEGEHHPNKAHYARLSYDTNPDLIVQLMKFVWGHEMPKLVISIQGGSANFELSARLGKIFQAGLIKVAKTTSAWVLSSGLNTGVTKHLGTALNNERWIGGSKRGRIVSVGVAPWGMIEQRNDLIGRNKERVYSPMDHASKFLHLNPRHSNFLLVDNGSVGKFGGENYFRRKFEKCISTYPASPDRGCDTPVVVVVLEGGCHTLNGIHDYLYDDPPIPVVIFAGTGKCADIVAWMVKKFTNEYELNDARDDIIKRVAHSFHVGINRCALLFQQLKEIFRKKNLISVYNPNATTEEEEFDSVILASIFRSQHWSPLQQLSLTLVWDRVDIAQAEVFVYGREWSRDNLEHAMMEALVSNRLDFVNLLLEHGLNMQQFLTASRLQALYSSKRIQSKLIESVLMELSQIRTSSSKKKDPHDKNLTLHDVGVAFSHMMGHVYRSTYIYLVAKSHDAKDGAVDEQEIRSQTFAQPFDDLFVWAIITKRHELGKILWVHGRGALAKALVAVKLNKYLVKELKSSEKTTTNLVVEFENNAEEWENLSVSLLDSCYRQDSKMARQLLTMELDNWSKQTCLMLAVMARHRMLLGHPCCQMLLADLWMGALNIKSNSSLKIVMGILLPPLVLLWDYKSREELQLLPHQEKSSILHHSILPHNNGIITDHLNPPTENQVFPTSVGVTSLDASSLRTYDATKSRGSINSIFNKRPNMERTTDLAEVVKKLNLSSTPTTTAFVTPDGMIAEPILRDVLHQPQRLVKVVERPAYTVSQVAGPHVFNLAPVNNALPDDQPFRFKAVNSSDHHSSFVTTQQSLPAWRKFIEFHKAPITNFFRHAIAYIIFMFTLAYVILYPQDPSSIGWVEIYVVACVFTQGLECIREFIYIDALSISQKLKQMGETVWQFGDFFVVIIFLVGTSLRLIDGYFEYGMVTLRTSSIYWNLRLYKFLGVHRFVGPKIVMMSRMFSHMVCFSMIIFVVIISFGMARESIRFPDMTPTFKDLAQGFLEPYIMMFGEVDLDALSPRCGDGSDDDVPCPIGSWLIPLCWVVYMMVSNVLIVNVLIAVFNRIYSEVDAMAMEVWMFQRFTFVMEFENKPTLPPPLIIICHLTSLMKFISSKFIHCICEEELLERNLDEDEKLHIIIGNDHSLKSFLALNEQHIGFDFEEENVDVIRAILLKEQTGSFGNGEMLANKLGISSEKLSIQQLKFGLQELYVEMEEQRNKLDKLTAYWEMDIANQGADNDENFKESEDVSSHESLVAPF